MRPPRSNFPHTTCTGILFAVLLSLGATAQEAAPDPRPVLLAPQIITGAAVAESLKLKEPIVLDTDLRVTHVGVGSFRREDDGKLRFVPANEVPLEVGGVFGWVVRFDTPRDSISLTEEFHLPANNLQWSVDSDKTTISDDGRKATTKYEISSLWDWAFHFWSFEKGDPMGEHRFVVRYGENEVANLVFRVVEPKP